MENKKICVYTCITGNYDNLNEINKNVYEKNIDYYCFTNNNNIKSDTWKVIYIEDKEISNQLLARKNKILGNDIVNKYDIIVWVDGNTIIKRKISDFIKEQTNIEKYDISFFKHRFRDCIYDEAIECVKMKKDKKEIIKEQIDFLSKDKYPRHNGLFETTVFVRKNNCKVKETLEKWYEMVSTKSIRDQLSINWVVYKNDISVYTINMNVFSNDYFEVISHNKNSDISSYRCYFGEDDSYENFDYDLDIQGQYEINNNLYTANVKTPKNTNYIKFEITDVMGVFFDNINVQAKGLKEYKINNWLEIKGKKYFYHVIPVIEIIGDFKKNDKITISLEMNKISEYEYNILVLDYNDEYQKSLIRENEKNVKSIQLETEVINLHNKLQSLQNENNNLKKENEEQSNRISYLENEYQKIIESKGWKALEKIRGIKNKI